MSQPNPETKPIAKNARGRNVPADAGTKRNGPRIRLQRKKEYDPERDFRRESESIAESWKDRFRIQRHEGDGKTRRETHIDARLVVAVPQRADGGRLREAGLDQTDMREALRKATLGFRRIHVRSWEDLDKFREATDQILQGDGHRIEDASVRESARGLVAMKVLEAGELDVLEAEQRIREGCYFADPFLALGGSALTSVLGPNDEFVPIVHGPFQKQLYLSDMLLAHARCFEAFNHNPIAKRLVELGVQFTLGRGVRPVARHPAVQKVIDDFWKSNDMDARLITWVRDLSWQGELFARFTPDGNGSLKAREIDPSTIWEVVTDPEDIEQVYYLHQQYQTQYQIYGGEAGVPTSRYIVRQIPPGEFDHVKINVSSGEKRGRSDLYPNLNFLKRFKDFYNAVVVRAQEEASHVWDITVEGSEADVDAVAEDQGFAEPPPPGSNWIHNDTMKIEALSLVTDQLGAGSRNIGEQILGILAVGAGYPPEWLSFRGTGATRASALTASEPAVKHVESRQRVIDRLLQRIKERVLGEAKDLPTHQIEQASLRNLISLIRSRKFAKLVEALTRLLTGRGSTYTVPLDTEVEFVFPEVRTENRTEKIRNLSAAEAQGSFSHRRTSELIASELDVTTYDFDEEMAERKEEEEAGIGPPANLGDDLLPEDLIPGGDEEPSPPAGSDQDNQDYRDNAGNP